MLCERLSRASSFGAEGLDGAARRQGSGHKDLCCRSRMRRGTEGSQNNGIRFPNRRSEACHICEAWPRVRRERLLIEDIPLTSPPAPELAGRKKFLNSPRVRSAVTSSEMYSSASLERQCIPFGFGRNGSSKLKQAPSGLGRVKQMTHDIPRRAHVFPCVTSNGRAGSNK